jgi:hypothetical protein
MVTIMDSEYGQSGSPFFNRLPPEIRHQICEALLSSAGLTQHIYKLAIGRRAPISHTRCQIDPDKADVRELRYVATFVEVPEEIVEPEQYYYEQGLWRSRQYTDWCNHWQCEEDSGAVSEDSVGLQHFSAFLGPLLTCKRMHDEFADLMYSTLTFSFVNVPALHRFLETTSPRYVAQIRYIHLIWCASVEVQDDGIEGLSAEDGGPDRGSVLDSPQNWTKLWTRLATRASRLHHVRIWFYGRLPRFPMPAPGYFKVLDDFADGTLSISGDREQAPKNLQTFTVQTVWTREVEAVVVDDREVPFDDGHTVFDWLRGRRFEVSRVPAVEYEPREWMAMWARAPPEDERVRPPPETPRGRGWGLRGKWVKDGDGRTVFVRVRE